MSSAFTVFGEVLFDQFPDGRTVLGGAPFNVAWHLAGFGARPLLVSRVGTDTAGRSILQAMRDWGMTTRGVALDDALPTGRVQVRFHDGEPAYEIERPAAWDAITAPDPLDGDNAGWLYHGSLALRDRRSEQALEDMLDTSGHAVLLDVNLRDPWWTAASLQEHLQRAQWAKLNDIELDHLAPAGRDETTRALRLMEKSRLSGLILTRGAQGALIMGPDGVLAEAPVPESTAVVDTVGAGDAFTAVMLLALEHNWPMQQGLDRALSFAAEVCGLRGATSPEPGFYLPMQAAWDLSKESDDHV